jgi:hypothetical protein
MRSAKPEPNEPLHQQVKLYEVVTSDEQSEYKALVDYCEFVVAVCTDPLDSSRPGNDATSIHCSSEVLDRPEIAGEYTTRRNSGLTYAYKACWTCIGPRITWSATVTREGMPKGFPNGTIPRLLSLDAAAAVRTLVEHSIETLAQVVY